MLNRINIFLKGELFKNSSIYFITTFISKILPFILLPFMTKYLNPHEYGVFATYYMYISFSLLIFGCELNRYLEVYYFKVSKKEFERYLSTVFSFVCIFSILGFILYSIIFLFIDSVDIGYYWFIIIPLLCILKFIVGINDVLLRNEEKAILYAKYIIFEILIYTLVSIVLAWLYYSWTSKAYGFVVSIVVLAVFSLIRLRKYYNLSFVFDKYILKKAFIYSLPCMFGLNLANILVANSDKIILLHFYDNSVVGILAIALVFASIVGFVTDSLMKAWIPIFYTKLQKKDKNVDKNCLYIFVFLSIVSVFTIFILMYIMRYMIDEKYYDAIDIMPYIAISYIFRIYSQILSNYINFYSITKAFYYDILIAFFINLIVAYLLVDYFGIIGMAISINLFFIFKSIVYKVVLFNFNKRKLN